MTGRALLAGAASLGLAFAYPVATPALGTFDIKPVVITFAAGATSASVEFTNAGSTPQELQVDVKAWTHDDANDDGTPTDDIIASPSIFVIAPGQAQLVRLGPARDLSGDVEKAYRLIATEVPPANAGGDMQTILRMRLPVFFAPNATDSVPLRWHVTRADATRLTVTTTNAGNVHRRVRGLRVTADGRVIFNAVVAAYVFALQSRRWSIPLRTGSAPATVSVHATEVDGSIEDSSFSVR